VSRDERLVLAFAALHPERRRVLVEHWGGERAAVAAVRAGKAEGLDPGLVRPVEECRASVARAGCRVIMHGDRDYPTALLAIADPPDVLFVRGDIPAAPAVAVVGTRRCTAYGLRIAAGYGRAIAAAGWTLVSGLARGIDAAAHRGTVDAGGAGVAVLGCGLDVVYPREHGSLSDRLLGLGGAVVSEYPPGTPPNGWRFPPRNRIIAGLSAAAVVVEAAVTGGALITAVRAVEQGRPVFAVPGDIDREASAGCNLLIRDGAVPVLDPADLVEALSLVVGPPRLQPVAAEDPNPGGDVEAAALIGPAGVTVDVLAARLGVSGPALLAMIGRMEVAGTVRRVGDVLLPGR
jgi:DNA processing protein